MCDTSTLLAHCSFLLTKFGFHIQNFTFLLLFLNFTFLLLCLTSLNLSHKHKKRKVFLTKDENSIYLTMLALEWEMKQNGRC